MPFAWSTMAWYDPDPVIRRRATFTVGAVVGAVILGCVWLATATMRQQGEDASSDPKAAAAVLGTQSAAPHETHAAPPDAAARCDRVYRAQSAPLRAAVASLDGWELHVEAMNRLIAGEITLGQATAFWDQTRRQAAGRLLRYDDAKTAFADRGVRCPSPDGPGVRAAGAQRCAAAVAARNVVLRRADVALATWSHHVHHMEMLREGTLSPKRATALWQQSWRTGVREIDRYRAAADRAIGENC